MDPSLNLSLVYDSFEQQRPVAVEPDTFSFEDLVPEVNQSIQLTNKDNLEPLLVDLDLYNRLGEIKDQYRDPNFLEARNATNPFENLGNSIFMDRAGVKLANIDAIFNLTQHSGGYLAMQSGGPFTFCDIAGAPGAWSEYVLWRKTESAGYGISLRDGIQWNKEKLDMKRLGITYGNDNTGDLYTDNAPWFVDWVKRSNVDGVDLCMADGGFNVDEKEEKQEFLTSHLILAEILVGIGATKPGGSFVVKVYDTVTSISADLLYLLALSFDLICLFKPISSRPANSERYVVCLGRRDNVVDPLRIATNAHQAMANGSMAENIVYSRDPRFDEWLTTQNNFHAESQIAAGEKILAYLRKEYQPNQLEFDIHRPFALWKIPDNQVQPNKQFERRQQSFDRAPSRGRGRGSSRGGTRRGRGRSS